MERILTGIDTRRPCLDALVRALCLGQRIRAKVSVLVVYPPGPEDRDGSDTGPFPEIEREIGSAKAMGTEVELFVTRGRYEQELMNAAKQLKTTLLVACAAGGDEQQGGEREPDRLGRILNGVDCRVELVSARKNREPEKDGK